MSKDPVSKTKDVRAAVDAELGFDPLVDAADITVRNIAGDVTLTGTVPSYPQYLEATAAARRVAGVTGVHNHLEVALPERDYRDDVKLATAANNALAANVTVPDSVEATAEDGNIILTGTASYGTERIAAEAAVAGLAGVRNVSNDIEISYALDPVEVDLHVQQALDRAALVPDDSDVTADTKDGIAVGTRITGRLGWTHPDIAGFLAGAGLAVLDIPIGLAPRALRDIEAGKAVGRFTVSDAEIALSAAAGGMLGLFRMRQRHPERVTEATVDQLTEAELRLLGVPADEAARLVALPLPDTGTW